MCVKNVALIFPQPLSDAGEELLQMDSAPTNNNNNDNVDSRPLDSQAAAASNSGFSEAAAGPCPFRVDQPSVSESGFSEQPREVSLSAEAQNEETSKTMPPHKASRRRWFICCQGGGLPKG